MTAVDLTLRERRARPAGRANWLTVPVILGLIVCAGWLMIALTIPLWSPYDPLATSGLPLLPPDAQHLLGTDALGRDVLARTLYGARASLPLAFAVIAGGVTIGCLLGGLAGFFGGWPDGILMRLTDVTLAFPAILLAMVMTAALGPGLFHAGIAMVIVWWPIYARLLRAQILSVKEQAHVEAAVAAGVGRSRLMRVHILPLALLIADEPTTALDVTIQAQILELLKRLVDERDVGLIVISHDLGVVAGVVDRVAVMYAGRIVEDAPVDDLFAAPRHPYTRALLGCLPRLDRPQAVLTPIPGAPPALAEVHEGCSFRTRCTFRQPRCDHEDPVLMTVGRSQAACLFADQIDVAPAAVDGVAP